MSNSSSPFPSCFNPTTTDTHRSPAKLPPISGDPNLTTCLYQTDLGLFSLTWSNTFLGRSLHLHHHHHHHHHRYQPLDDAAAAASPLSLSTASFHLNIKPFLFWKNHGCKTFKSHHNTTPADIQIFWDLTKAKFGSGPEPRSGFYIAVVVGGEMTLLVGDLVKEAYKRSKSQKPEISPILVLRREHVIGKRVYNTRAKIGGRMREISINCSGNDDARLSFSIDNKRVLQIKRLKWKFRGNERIEVEGVNIQISWDVYNWLFEDESDTNNGHAVFMFKFEETENSEMAMWGTNSHQSLNIGMNVTEWRKIRRSLVKTGRSSSFSSFSSASSGCSSSVMEWACMKDDEVCSPAGFSLLVYAWKR